MIEMEKELIKELLRECYKLAKDSPDRSNQNGAVIVDSLYWETNILSRGRNEFPEKIEVTEDMITDREKKLFYIEHAERNAIYALANKGVKAACDGRIVQNGLVGINGTIMICPWFACSDCARAIALSGIKKVIGHRERMDMTPDRWKASVDAGLQLLRDCGVELEFYEGHVGAEQIIVNGELWKP
jgi:deoxycytidylate deaminase